MGTKILFGVILIAIMSSCNSYEKESIVLNYKDGYIQILSDKFVIDSISIYNYVKPYRIIRLTKTDRGNNVLYFNTENSDYEILVDSLRKNCSETQDMELPSVNIVFRAKGYTGNYDTDHRKLKYANYNKIPCSTILIDTISTNNPFK